MAALAGAPLPAAASGPAGDRATPGAATDWRAEVLARAVALGREQFAGRAAAPRTLFSTSPSSFEAMLGPRRHACWRRTYPDPAADSPGVDVTDYALAYACRYGLWYLDAVVREPLPSDAAPTLMIDLDTDARRSTGCDGADIAVVAFDISALLGLGPDPLGGIGFVFSLDSHCYPEFAPGFAVLRRESDRHLTLVFDEGGVGGPRSFRWRAAATSISIDDLLLPISPEPQPGLVDVYPDNGYRAAWGYQLNTTGGSSGSSYLRRGPSLSLDGDHDALLSGDWNGDGRDDLLFYGFGSRPDALWLSRTTTNGFRPGKPLKISSYAEPVAGDFNGDGRDDILLRGFEGDSSLLVADGTGAFVRGPHVYVPNEYDFASPGDFNGDGRTDLFLSSAFEGHEKVLYARATSYGFVSGAPISVPGELLLPSAGDFNGDGRDDMLFAAGSGKDPDVLLYAKTASTGFTRSPTPTVPLAWPRVTGDFDGDGDGDLLDHGYGPDRDRLIRTDPGGVFAWKSVVFNGVHSGVATGDFNSDGHDDLLLWGNGHLPDQVWYGQD